MKLKGRIYAISIVPIFLLSVVLVFLGLQNIRKGVYAQAYDGMEASAVAIREMFGLDPGDFQLDGSGNLVKGLGLNISRSDGIVNSIKESSEMDVTVFYGDTRYLTSIKNEEGEPDIGTKASDKVVETVLQQGKDYQNDDVEIRGVRYLAYYTPLYNAGSKEPVGMVFLGLPYSKVADQIRSMQRQLLIVAVILIIIVLIEDTIFIDKIVRALVRTIKTVSRLSEGNLDAKMNPKYMARTDEIGELARKVDGLQKYLEEIVGKIKQQGENLTGASGQLQQISSKMVLSMDNANIAVKNIAQATSEQAAESQTVGENVSSMGEMVNDALKDVEELNETNIEMKGASSQAAETLLALNRIMDHVTETIRQIYDQTNTTNDSVKKISEKMDIITEIASQTSLLSLNANIEAARAGEHGRGFAVVASEIQQLSEQCNNSAGEIKEILGQLTSNSNRAVSTMGEAQKIIEKQGENVRKTDEVFQVVNIGIQNTIEGIATVSKKVGQMGSIKTESVKSVETLSAIAEENAACTEETAASVDEVHELVAKVSEQMDSLNQISQKLEESIEVFHFEA